MNKRELRKLLCSMLLGDGSLVNEKVNRPCGNQIYFSVSHSMKQEDYLLYKVDLINQIFIKKGSEKRIKLGSPYNIRLKNDDRYKDRIYSARKATLRWMDWFKHLYPRIYKYKNGLFIKDVEYLLGQIDSDKHLFLWFADDASEVRSKGKHRTGETYFRNPHLHLYTNGYTEGQNQILKQWFERRYKVFPTIVNSGWQNGRKSFLRFSSKEAAKLFPKIAVYVKQIPSISHKFRLCLERYA